MESPIPVQEVARPGSGRNPDERPIVNSEIPRSGSQAEVKADESSLAVPAVLQAASSSKSREILHDDQPIVTGAATHDAAEAHHEHAAEAEAAPTEHSDAKAAPAHDPKAKEAVVAAPTYTAAKQGTLKKRVRVLLVKVWRARHYVLTTSGWLLEFKAPGDSTPAEKYDLNKEKIALSSHENKTNEFELHLKTSKEILLFLCDSQKEVQEWTAELKKFAA